MLGSAYVNALDTVGDNTEKVIAFISPLIAFVVIAALIGKLQGKNLFLPIQVKVIAILFVAMTIIEHIYPVFRYSDQTLPSDYWTLFFIQFLLNAYIAKVITNEHN